METMDLEISDKNSSINYNEKEPLIKRASFISSDQSQKTGIYNTFYSRLKNYSSRERRIWNLLIVIVTMYNSIVIPLRLSFRDTWVKSRATYVLLVFDYFGDLLLLLDIALRFVTPYYYDGILVRDKKSIAKNYLRTW